MRRYSNPWSRNPGLEGLRPCLCQPSLVTRGDAGEVTARRLVHNAWSQTQTAAGQVTQVPPRLTAAHRTRSPLQSPSCAGALVTQKPLPVKQEKIKHEKLKLCFSVSMTTLGASFPNLCDSGQTPRGDMATRFRASKTLNFPPTS